MDFRDKLHQAGTLFDGRPGELPGHVTNGSLEAQVQVVESLLREFKSELKVAGDFGLFKDHLPSNDRPLPEYVAIEVLKKFAEDRGLRL